MTGDWASFVQILILSLVELNVCDVPVVVLNNINLIVKIVDDVDSFSPDTSLGSCDRRASPTPCRLGD